MTKSSSMTREWEFKAIYDTRDRVLPLLTEHGVRYTELRPPRPFVFDMLDKPVNSKKNGLHYGYSWCGGCARWGTACKTHTLDQHAKEAGKNVFDLEARFANGKGAKPNV